MQNISMFLEFEALFLYTQHNHLEHGSIVTNYKDSNDHGPCSRM